MRVRKGPPLVLFFLRCFLAVSDMVVCMVGAGGALASNMLVKEEARLRRRPLGQPYPVVHGGGGRGPRSFLRSFKRLPECIHTKGTRGGECLGRAGAAACACAT